MCKCVDKVLGPGNHCLASHNYSLTLPHLTFPFPLPHSRLSCLPLSQNSEAMVAIDMPAGPSEVGGDSALKPAALWQRKACLEGARRI